MEVFVEAIFGVPKSLAQHVLGTFALFDEEGGEEKGQRRGWSRAVRRSRVIVLRVPRAVNRVVGDGTV